MPSSNPLALLDMGAQFEQMRADIRADLSIFDHFDASLATEADESGIRKARADVNARRKALDDDRKRIKREYMAPYEEFERMAKDVIAEYDVTLERFDEALGRITSERRDQVLTLIQHTLEDSAPLLVGLVKPETIMATDARLRRKGLTPRKAESIVLDAVEAVARDHATLCSMTLDYPEVAKATLFSTLDIGKALAANAEEVARAEAQKEAAAIIQQMEEEQAAYCNPLPTVSEPERITITITFRDITNAQRDALLAFCRSNDIHGRLINKEV